MSNGTFQAVYAEAREYYAGDDENRPTDPVVRRRGGEDGRWKLESGLADAREADFECSLDDFDGYFLEVYSDPDYTPTDRDVREFAETMNRWSDEEVVTSQLELAIDDDDADAARAAATAALELGMAITVESDDPDDDGYPRHGGIETTQSHGLYVDGERIATITRQGWSYFDDGKWTTDSANGDRDIPAAWQAVCDVAGLHGDWESAPRAPEPETCDD